MQEIVLSNIQPAPGMQSSTVKLDEKFEEASVEEFYAYFTAAQVTLTRISTFDGNHPYGPIRADIMDALCDAWESFKAQCQKVELEERWRVKKVLEQVDAIVAEYPDIVIAHHEGNYREYWAVDVKKLSAYKDDIYTADRLLEVVQAHKTRLALRKIDQQTVKAILDNHSEIVVKRDPNFNRLFINVSYGDWTRGIVFASTNDTQELLEAVLDAEKDLLEHKAEAAPVSE